MREVLSMVVVLSLICSASGLVLSGLKAATKDKIREQELTYVQGPAIESVFGEHDNDPIKDRKSFELPDGSTVTVFPSIKGGELQSVALEASAQGYGGDLGVMVGFDVGEDQLSGIGITTMKETPGVGTLVAGESFTHQFRGHPPANLQLASKGGDIDAVSGATYSSLGAVNAVQKAANIYEELKDKLEQAWGKGS